MAVFKPVEVFNDRYPWIGPSLWMASIQYFIVMLVVALDWSNPAYSISKNTISDLGNTVCGIYGQRVVCSPLHAYMNASFILLGLTMLLGSMLIYNEFKKSLASKLGFTSMALAGVGTILVGLFPENTISKLHYGGALLPFFVGNVGILILGLALEMHLRLKVYSVATAILALSALVFFTAKHYLGLGQGGMERLVSYPQTLWLIIFGVYMSRKRFKRVFKQFSLSKK